MRLVGTINICIKEKLAHWLSINERAGVLALSSNTPKALETEAERWNGGQDYNEGGAGEGKSTDPEIRGQIQIEPIALTLCVFARKLLNLFSSVNSCLTALLLYEMEQCEFTCLLRAMATAGCQSVAVFEIPFSPGPANSTSIFPS